MARCTADTKRGKRCKNAALEGGQRCKMHEQLHQERRNTREGEAAPGAERSPATRRADGRGAPESSGRTATPPEAAGSAPEGSAAALEGLEAEDPGPPPSRDRVSIDPALFRDLEADEQAEQATQSPVEPTSPSPPTRRGALLDANPGPWSPAALEGMVLPPLNRRFSGDGVAELEGAEADAFLEAAAASLNRIAARVDPHNPYAALVMCSGIMLGTRYAPRLFRRRKKTERASTPDREPVSSAGPGAPDDDGPAATWADALAPTL